MSKFVMWYISALAGKIVKTRYPTNNNFAEYHSRVEQILPIG